MAPKGGNAKKESGRAKKAENEVSVGCERGEIAKVTRPLVGIGNLLTLAMLWLWLWCAIGKEKGCS